MSIFSASFDRRLRAAKFQANVQKFQAAWELGETIAETYQSDLDEYRDLVVRDHTRTQLAKLDRHIGKFESKLAALRAKESAASAKAMS